MKILGKFFFIALVVILCSPYPAFSLEPEDILIVYNNNMEESKKVAEYYATKRKVPANNLIGVALPDSETIARSRYEADLLPHAKESINTLKNNGRNPVILLIHGIPIRIKHDRGNENKQLLKLAEPKLEELGDLVSTLTERLEKITSSDTGTIPAQTEPSPLASDPQHILKKAKQSLINMTESKRRLNKLQVSPGSAQEMASIVFRLAGITSLVTVAQQKLETKNEKGPLNKDALRQLSALVNSQLAPVPFRGITKENVYDVASLVRTSRGLIGELEFWLGIKEANVDSQMSASVDSELTMLLTPTYSKARWLPNPFLDQFNSIPGIDEFRSQTIMVARLDGPSPQTAMRLVDDAIWTENHGLEGVFYIDARGLKSSDKENYYAQFDKHLRKLYQIITEKSSMKVVLDDKPELFPEQCCSNAALYCGWYSLAKYVDSFTWQKGAVGFHVASAEAKTLRKPGSQVWCKRMLEEGVAATLGPVNEPYLQSFPLPDVFFPLLMTGKIPLIEVYYRSTPYLSWRQILIGDPLYTPFLKKPAIILE